MKQMHVKAINFLCSNAHTEKQKHRKATHIYPYSHMVNLIEMYGPFHRLDINLGHLKVIPMLCDKCHKNMKINYD